VTQSRLLSDVDSEFRSKFVEQKAESSSYGRRLDRFLFSSYGVLGDDDGRNKTRLNSDVMERVGMEKFFEIF